MDESFGFGLRRQTASKSLFGTKTLNLSLLRAYFLGAIRPMTILF
jgi:hypothetical protein